MANTQDVELEAAKFLHKLIQESKDEPTKLATKLYVILQHMKSSGKEDSRPYQVISRDMETVIKQHNLDIETLMSSCLPLPAGTKIGDSASLQIADEIYLYFKDTFGMACNANKPAQSQFDTQIIQQSIPSSLSEARIIRSATPRDTGKCSVSMASGAGFRFTVQQLKQLRAQCVVFLAFRNGLLPKKLHLEIALGNFYYKEDGPHRYLIDQKGKEQTLLEKPTSTTRKMEAEIQPHEGIGLHASATKELHDLSIRETSSRNLEADSENDRRQT